MVLEEATSPYGPTAQTYDTPTSDLDPYASSSSSSSSLTHLTIAQPSPGQPLSIDLQTLPQPLVVLSAQRTESLKKGIEATCLWGQKVANRPLRQDEAEAFAYHWAHSMQVASYGTPIGAALGTAWAYTRKGYQFPAWKGPGAEGSKLSPDAFGPLRGASARMLWQGLRFSSYGFVGLLFGQLFFASYALTLHAANRALDPRLKDFTEALRARQKEGVAEAVGREVQAEARDLRRGETFEMARQRRSVQMAQQGRGKVGAGRDDMSPTGGAFTEDFMQTTDPNEMMSDGQSRDQQYRTDTASNTFGLANETPASSPAAESRSAGMTQLSQSQQQQQQQPQQSQRSSSQPQRPASGSAWDRLRQNALSGTSSPTPSSHSTSSNTNPARNTDDGYTFSSSEEERQLARPQAQQEFDARIEQERQGRDFGGGESGSGGYGGGGWRKG